jgi:ribosomal protein S18 acetylase RimI-like enzyme
VLTQISAAAETYEVRRAAQADVPAIVALLAADQIGATRDGGADLEPYVRAFAAIDADPAQLLVVVTEPGGAEVVATLQLTVIPSLARRGSLRGQIEAVRVHEDARRFYERLGFTASHEGFKLRVD